MYTSNETYRRLGAGIGQALGAGIFGTLGYKAKKEQAENILKKKKDSANAREEIISRIKGKYAPTIEETKESAIDRMRKNSQKGAVLFSSQDDLNAQTIKPQQKKKESLTDLYSRLTPEDRKTLQYGEKEIINKYNLQRQRKADEQKRKESRLKYGDLGKDYTPEISKAMAELAKGKADTYNKLPSYYQQEVARTFNTLNYVKNTIITPTKTVKIYANGRVETATKTPKAVTPVDLLNKYNGEAYKFNKKYLKSKATERLFSERMAKLKADLETLKTESKRLDPENDKEQLKQNTAQARALLTQIGQAGKEVLTAKADESASRKATLNEIMGLPVIGKYLAGFRYNPESADENTKEQLAKTLWNIADQLKDAPELKGANISSILSTYFMALTGDPMYPYLQKDITKELRQQIGK